MAWWMPDVRTRNYDPGVMNDLIEKATSYTQASKIGTPPGATTFGLPTDDQSTPGGGRATAYPVQASGSEGPEDSTAQRIGQAVGLAKGGLSLAGSLPGIGSSVRGYEIPGLEGSSAAGSLGGGLDLLGAGSLAAQGDYPRAAMSGLKGASNLYSGLTGSELFPYAGQALGALGTLYGGYQTYKQGVDDPAGMRSLINTIGSGLMLTPAAPIGLALMAGTGVQSIFGQPQEERRIRDARQASLAGQVYQNVGEGLGVGDLNAPVPGGGRSGDVLQGILEAVLQGREGWKNPQHFNEYLGWAPQQSYVGLAGLLKEQGYDPNRAIFPGANPGSRGPGTNIAELVTSTEPPYQSLMTGQVGRDRWKSLIDSLAPLGIGHESASPWKINPASTAAYDRWRMAESAREAQTAKETAMGGLRNRLDSGGLLTPEEETSLMSWISENPAGPLAG